jgi:hypothetical protein
MSLSSALISSFAAFYAAFKAKHESSSLNFLLPLFTYSFLLGPLTTSAMTFLCAFLDGEIPN